MPTPRSGDTSRSVEGFRLICAKLSVNLLDDPHRARYEYECHLETTGEVPARYWCYHLPAESPDVTDVRAWDAAGKLQPRLLGEGKGSRLEMRLRYPVRAGERYTFCFAYECSARPVLVPNSECCLVTYSDWVNFNVPCCVLDVTVALPSSAALVASVPASAADESDRFTCRLHSMRALETASFLVAYRRPPLPRA